MGVTFEELALMAMNKVAELKEFSRRLAFESSMQKAQLMQRERESRRAEEGLERRHVREIDLRKRMFDVENPDAAKVISSMPPEIREKIDTESIKGVSAKAFTPYFQGVLGVLGQQASAKEAEAERALRLKLGQMQKDVGMEQIRASGIDFLQNIFTVSMKGLSDMIASYLNHADLAPDWKTQEVFVNEAARLSELQSLYIQNPAKFFEKFAANKTIEAVIRQDPNELRKELDEIRKQPIQEMQRHPELDQIYPMHKWFFRLY